MRKLFEFIGWPFKAVQEKDSAKDAVYLPIIEPAPKRQTNEATRPTYRPGNVKPSEFQKVIDLSG